MNYKKIVLAGGTGFVGKYLKTKFSELGYEVKIISRQNDSIQWDDISSIVDALDNSEMLINLAGKSVDCRYNKKNKEEILKSRTETTQLLGEILLKCKNPPELWINSSTATIYRHAQDRPMTESGGEIGSGFSVGVATQWEKTFFDFQLPKTRQVALRMAIILGKEGGVMTPFKNLVRFGLGGKQGDGKQMFSWIHIEDLFGIIQFLKSNKNMIGAYNCSAPNPVSNEILMRSLRQAMNVKFGLPSPKFLLEIGAIMIRTETELILKSRWVIPERLTKAGFQFQYSTIDKALENILIEKGR
ncbi:MAG TPA: TIGR01777 family oxidoreductase [Leptospiraceae bacterium]|nr:TIGR01777 family oxidoreductase [Leptospiraceae bacterium]